ncbi:MAG: TolC family protein [Thermoguttaceae bacterium]|nr:TolC family protein [Thermoguttaceae bacterium]
MKISDKIEMSSPESDTVRNKNVAKESTSGLWDRQPHGVTALAGLVGMFCVGLILLSSPGCSRQHYREKADTEVYDLLNTVDECNPLWKMDHFSLEADSSSRYADFHDPDAQPMPQDDATAHRLMQCVDGKKGSKKWTKNGVTDTVENVSWRQSLPPAVDGKIIIDADTAFDLALMHSPDYRTAFENVYISALGVTAERFAYDVKFYGGDSLFYNNVGGFRKDSVSTLRNDLGPGSRANSFATKKFATGGELVIGLANSLVWTFSPDGDTFTPTTTLGYGFTQPFLRGAGRAIVLESLTQSERILLANVRQLAFYQQGFYVNVLTGNAPVRQPGTTAYPTRGVSSIALGSSSFYGLLSTQVRIRNQQANVISLQDNLNRYEELFKAGRVSGRDDVDRVRQKLLTGESTLISQKDTYENNVDTFLVSTIGLPPDIKNLVIRDPLLDKFVLMPEKLTQVTAELNDLLVTMRDSSKEIPKDLKSVLAELKKGVEEGEKETLDDVERLRKDVYPGRVKGFATLSKRLKEDHPEIDNSFCLPATLEQRVKLIAGDFDRSVKELDEFGNERKKGVKLVIQDIFRLLELTVGTYDRPTLTKMLEDTRKNPGQSPFSQEVIDLVYELQLDQLLIGNSSATFESQLEGNKTLAGSDGLDEKTKKELAKKFSSEIERQTNQILNEGENKDDIYRIWIRDCLSRFGDELMGLRLVQARARLETLNLALIDIKAEDGFVVAAENRLDWMNARSILVDEWRNMEIVANTLKGYLDVSVSGSITNEGSNPVNFSAKNAKFTTGVAFDAPLTRLLERNAYRTALIRYDQARRAYYNYVDGIKVQVRSTIRAIQLNQMNFELQRENVLTAIQRVQQAQLKLAEPPTSGSNIGSLGTSAAQNLVDSLTDLLSAQNSLMETWLSYRAQRMGLLLVLGVFQLDENGKWIDPGNITTDYIKQFMLTGNQPQDAMTGINQLPATQQLTGGVPLEALGPAVDNPSGETGSAQANTVPEGTAVSAENSQGTTARSGANVTPPNPRTSQVPAASSVPVPGANGAVQPDNQQQTRDHAVNNTSSSTRNSNLGVTKQIR